MLFAKWFFGYKLKHWDGKENYSCQIHNSEVANVTLGCSLQDIENISMKQANWSKKDKTSGMLLCLLDNDAGK